LGSPDFSEGITKITKKYNVCVVGIGAVGTEMLRLLRSRNFPSESLTILARSDREEVIDGQIYQVRKATPEAFDGMDFAFFAGTEGAKGASLTLGWEAVQRGCVVIDNGDDFRMDDRVPLIVPEINTDALNDHRGLVANPNCSTIIALMALAPLHRAAGLSRVVACTYQAVSGSGGGAVDELDAQSRGWADGKTVEPDVYPHPIAFNVLAQIGSVKDASGATSEEQKMQRETHKILGDPSIRISSTCVRVPVFNAHSEALHVELKKPLSVEQARKILGDADGVDLVDNVDDDQYPTPLAASGIESVLVGRIRRDDVFENGLALFAAGDNLWKGAALNAIQIAEAMIRIGADTVPASAVGNAGN
jgi:aspartate-semialdehyde dehydrogenase